MVTEAEKLRRHYWESMDSKLDVWQIFQDIFLRASDLMYRIAGSKFTTDRFVLLSLG